MSKQLQILNIVLETGLRRTQVQTSELSRVL
jgi:hypothetical protein